MRRRSPSVLMSHGPSVLSTRLPTCSTWRAVFCRSKLGEVGLIALLSCLAHIISPTHPLTTYPPRLGFCPDFAYMGCGGQNALTPQFSGKDCRSLSPFPCFRSGINGHNPLFSSLFLKIPQRQAYSPVTKSLKRDGVRETPPRAAVARGLLWPIAFQVFKELAQCELAPSA